MEIQESSDCLDYQTHIALGFFNGVCFVSLKARDEKPCSCSNAEQQLSLYCKAKMGLRYIA